MPVYSIMKYTLVVPTTECSFLGFLNAYDSFRGQRINVDNCTGEKKIYDAHHAQQLFPRRNCQTCKRVYLRRADIVIMFRKSAQEQDKQKRIPAASNKFKTICVLKYFPSLLLRILTAIFVPSRPLNLIR